MNATLRFNEALLITGRAFQPFNCVTWVDQGGDGSLDLSVLDRTGTRLLGLTRIPSSAYSNREQLADLLIHAREELNREGYDLQDWRMPE
ncbi:hypothetical protein [Pseudomonas panipatensis]|uniref:DUF1652 domain-containing protein n=1 Tax=Pseudomonas panipatensis TaxID=428992 RepID=A0A1G8FEA3_9PSED|nr:hypothetical protein [Pseudomonas panipatensis]SDH80478.1 hypothetical protein SAMN05216272_103195 [Pseudomonas panipatensis]SMP54266.1 hypothetical protein SAMN06295951_103264 [Pseudomonas panipatensis]